MSKKMSQVLALSLIMAGAMGGLAIPEEKQKTEKTKYDIEALEKEKAKRERKRGKKKT